MILYARLAIYALVSVAVSFVVTAFRVSILILDGLHTYIHPESIQNDRGGTRALIKRPAMYNAGNGSVTGREDPSQAKGRAKRDKLKKDFDEANAQIFRLRLGDSHIQTREYYKDYEEAFIYASFGLANLLVYQFLPECSTTGHSKAATLFFSGDLVPFFVGSHAVYKMVRLLLRLSFERSASRKSEKVLSVVVGVLGFAFSALVIFVFVPYLVDLKVGSSDNLGSKEKDSPKTAALVYLKIFLAMFSGWIAGLLFIPAHRSVRSFWLGTDQLSWNLPVFTTGKITKTLMYLNMIMPVFTSLLWLKPMANVFILQSSPDQRLNSIVSDQSSESVSRLSECLKSSSGFRSSLCSGSRGAELPVSKGRDPFKRFSDSARNTLGESQEKWYSWRNFYMKEEENWTENIGFPQENFAQFRIWCLLFTALLQVLLMRPYLQTYLNEAVLSWYERLHSSRVPNLDFSRAKLFLHNHFICQVALQFFIPGILTLLLLGLSQIKDSSFSSVSFLKSIPSSSCIIKETTLYTAWWIQFVWALLTCSLLGLYRVGLLMI